MKSRNLFFACLLAGFIFFNAPNAPAFETKEAFAPENLFVAESFRRTELYFGTAKPDGSVVTDAEWSDFLAREVTTRFPEGFTVLDGFGQFQDSAGKIVREKSFCLILLYPKKERRANDPKIEAIRAAYKKAFGQESVLRVDFRQTMRISF